MTKRKDSNWSSKQQRKAGGTNASIRDEAKAISLDDEVKWAIIGNGALVGQTPATLSGSAKMTTDLQYDAHKLTSLCGDLRKIVTNHNGRDQVKCSDVSSADTVDAEIKLVHTAIFG